MKPPPPAGLGAGAAAGAGGGGGAVSVAPPPPERFIFSFAIILAVASLQQRTLSGPGGLCLVVLCFNQAVAGGLRRPTEPREWRARCGSARREELAAAR